MSKKACRVVEINTCSECPHSTLNALFNKECTLTNEALVCTKDEYVIPDTCPLPTNKPNDVVIFQKEYDGESLYDLNRDITECFDPDFNDKVKQIPDGDAFLSENFEVIVIWQKEEGA